MTQTPPVTEVNNLTIPAGGAMHDEFRANRAIIMEAEKRNYEALIPGYDLIPLEQRADRIREELKRLTSRQLTLIHAMQTSSTGPRAKAAPKPKKAEISLDDLI